MDKILMAAKVVIIRSCKEHDSIAEHEGGEGKKCVSIEKEKRSRDMNSDMNTESPPYLSSSVAIACNCSSEREFDLGASASSTTYPDALFKHASPYEIKLDQWELTQTITCPTA